MLSVTGTPEAAAPGSGAARLGDAGGITACGKEVFGATGRAESVIGGAAG